MKKFRKYIQDRKNFFQRKVSIQLNRFLLLICLFWAIPAVLLIRIVRPWINIRVGTLVSNRIGNFVDDVSQQWIALSEKPANQLDLYWLCGKTCNEQWAKMVRRNFKVAWWVRHLDFWNNILPGGKAHHRSSSSLLRDKNGILERTKKYMKFLPEEDQTAKNWLRQQGWQEDEQFACLLVRDNAYLDSDPLFILDKGTWGYHSYRNSDIADFVPAMEWLADQGVWILRMGKIMEKPMPSQHKRIIDYAFHPEKNDFLDIWLFAHCNLCISTGTGPDIVSSVYRRPMLFVDFIQLCYLWSWTNGIHFPKKLVWKSSGKTLTLQEYLHNSYFKTEEYHHAGIKVLDSTSEDILCATQECWQRIQGSWIDTENDLQRHEKFWEILKSWPKYSSLHNWIHPNNRVGTTWLRSHKDIFFTKDKQFFSSQTSK